MDSCVASGFRERSDVPAPGVPGVLENLYVRWDARVPGFLAERRQSRGSWTMSGGGLPEPGWL